MNIISKRNDLIKPRTLIVAEIQSLPSQSQEENNLQNSTVTQGGGDAPGINKSARGKAPRGRDREERPSVDTWEGLLRKDGMRGNRPPLLLPEETALAAAFPGARTLGGPAPPGAQAREQGRRRGRRTYPRR